MLYLDVMFRHGYCKKTVYSIKGIGKAGQPQAKEWDLHYTQKNNSKWIKGLKARPEAIRVLDENIGGKLFDIGPGNDFFELIPKTKAIKAKASQWDYTTLKSLYPVKETTNKVQSQPTEWEKISANRVSGQELISKETKNSSRSTAKEPQTT